MTDVTSAVSAWDLQWQGLEQAQQSPAQDFWGQVNWEQVKQDGHWVNTNTQQEKINTQAAQQWFPGQKNVQDHLPNKRVEQPTWLSPVLQKLIVEQSWWDLLKANHMTQQISSLQAGRMMTDENIAAMLSRQAENQQVMQPNQVIQHDKIEPVVKQDRLSWLLNELEEFITTPQQAQDAWQLAAQAAQQNASIPDATVSEEGTTTEANVDQPNVTPEGWEQEWVAEAWQTPVLTPEILESINELVRETGRVRMENLSLEQEKQALIDKNHELIKERVDSEKKHSLDADEAEFVAISRRFRDNQNAVNENALLNWLDKTFSWLGMDTKWLITDFISKKWMQKQNPYSVQKKETNVVDFLPR